MIGWLVDEKDFKYFQKKHNLNTDMYYNYEYNHTNQLVFMDICSDNVNIDLKNCQSEWYHCSETFNIENDYNCEICSMKCHIKKFDTRKEKIKRLLDES